MPSASETMATTVTKGVLKSVRRANFRLSIMVERVRRRCKEISLYMSRATQLARHIERTVTGPMWHGPALAHVLERVTHEQAAMSPIRDAHSIWAIVLHVAVWAEISRARLTGQRTGDPTADEDWPPVT